MDILIFGFQIGVVIGLVICSIWFFKNNWPASRPEQSDLTRVN